MDGQTAIINKSSLQKYCRRGLLLGCALMIGGLLLPFLILKTASARAVSDPGTLLNTAAASQGPDLAVTKSHSGDVFQAPDGGLFSIEVENVSGQIVSGPVTVTDVLPGKLITSSLITSNGWDPCDLNQGKLECVFRNTQGIPAKGALPPIQFNARFAATSVDVLTNTVTMANPSDTNPSNNTYRDLIIVNSADLKVTKAVSNAAPLEGEKISFTVEVRNKGPDTANGVVLYDKLPAGLTYLSSTISSGTYNSSTGHWEIGSISMGTTEKLKITARVNVGTFNETIINHAKLLPFNPYDPDTSDNQASAGVYVSPAVDLQVTKSDGLEYIYPNYRTTFTVTITNTGNITATGIVVTDTLGIDYTYITDTLEITASRITTHTLVWRLEEKLGPGDGLDFYLEARALEFLSEAEDLTNTIFVTSDQVEGNLENNTDEDFNKAVYLRIIKTVKPKRAAVGEALVFDISVSNPSDYPAYDVFVTDVFPDFMDITRATTTKGYTPRIDNIDKTVLVDIGVVDPDKPVQIIIDTRVNDRARGYAERVNKPELRGKTPDLRLDLPVWTGYAPYTVIGEVLPSTGGRELKTPPIVKPDTVPIPGSLLGTTGILLLFLGIYAHKRFIKLGFLLISTGLVILAVGCSALAADSFPGSGDARRTQELVTVLRGTKPPPPATIPGSPEGIPPAVTKESSFPTQPLSSPIPGILTPTFANPLQTGQTSQAGFQEAWAPAEEGEAARNLPDFPVPEPDRAADPLPGQDWLDDTPPERMLIPIIGVDSPVKYVPYKQITWLVAGLTHEIAWMGDTSWPGLGGNTAMAGHVTMRDGSEGPFRRLQVLNPGDEIFLQTGKYNYTYQVRELVIVPDYEFSVLESTESPQLTLVTCTGWDEELEIYLERLVLYADLVESSPR